MITLKKAQDRGFADQDSLSAFSTFSVPGGPSPGSAGFHGLRIIDEDTLPPGGGIDTRGSEDQEFLFYVLEGVLAYMDSIDNGTVIRRGDIQRISAGRGIRHSEFNGSMTDRVRFLQIGFAPRRKGLAPGIELKTAGPRQWEGPFQLIASPDGRDSSLTIHADAQVYAGRFDQADTGEVPLASGRHAWVHLASGRARVNGIDMAAGDGAALSGEASVLIEGLDASEALVFDLA